jgi:hypothetical protein
MLEIVHVRSCLGFAMLGIGCALVGGQIGAPQKPAPAPAPEIAIADEPVELDVPEIATTQDALPAAAPILLVFELDHQSYIALEQLDHDTLPEHGAFRQLKRGDDSYVDSVIATTSVPAWSGREVIVDGACHARLTDFVIVSRLTGDPGYASETDERDWTVKSILEHGNIVLAAKLVGCHGSFARDAAAPPAHRFEDITDSVREAAAETTLITSQAAAEQASAWHQDGGREAWTDAATFTRKVMRDTATGVEWISIHAYSDSGCGGPHVNVWGLYRVEPNGTLATVQSRGIESMTSLDTFVDIDGDGVPEVIGTSWLGNHTIVEDADGRELTRLEVPFFGCPC